MKPQLKLFLVFCLMLNSCVPVVTTGDGSETIDFFSDENFSEKVGFAQIMDVGTGKLEDRIPVKRVSSAGTLTLLFDLLEAEFRYTYARIIHCNANWKQSSLNDIEFLSEYNEIPINNYTFSESNLTPYVSYRFKLPRVSKTGNYVVAIYSEESDELLLTRRYTIYKQTASISYSLSPSSNVGKRSENHQIQFDVNYNNLEVNNPMVDIKVVMLQNHNWNTAITGLEPTLIKPDLNYLEFQHFNEENNFPAINEFRFFDTRMLSARGTNVERIFRSPRGVEVMVQKDKSRASDVYSEVLINDLNGGFYLSNIDPNESQSQSEYTYVNFALNTTPIEGEVYVTGRFNNWQLNADNKLNYNSDRNQYEGSVYLKQGFYNYMYFVKSPYQPYFYYEGTHFQTINNYEIIVYYREPGTIYDQVIGYQQFSSRN